MVKRPTFAFNQYRVDFEPSLENAFHRKALLNTQRPALGGFLYDNGSTIYITRKLAGDSLVFEGEIRSTGTKHTVRIKNTGNVIKSTDGEAIQVYNTILRRVMGELRLEQMGRNLYDSASKVRFLFFFCYVLKLFSNFLGPT